MWYSEFHKSQYTLIYKLIKSHDIFFPRGFLCWWKLRTSYLTARKEIFLKPTGPQRMIKIEMRILGITGGFLFLTFSSSLNRWNTLVDADGLWVAIKSHSRSPLFLRAPGWSHAPPHHHYGLSAGFGGAHSFLLSRKGTFPRGHPGSIEFSERILSIL